MRELGLARTIGGKPAETSIDDKGAACPLDKVSRTARAGFVPDVLEQAIRYRSGHRP